MTEVVSLRTFIVEYVFFMAMTALKLLCAVGSKENGEQERSTLCGQNEMDNYDNTWEMLWLKTTGRLFKGTLLSSLSFSLAGTCESHYQCISI